MGAVVSCGAAVTPKRVRRPSLAEPVRERKLSNVESIKAATLKRVASYHIGKYLGSGAYGTCYEATNARGQVVAIKVLDNTVLARSRGFAGAACGPVARPAATSGRSKVEREIAVMKSVRHPNCVRLFEVIDDPSIREVISP